MAAERSYRRFEAPSRFASAVEHAWITRDPVGFREVSLPDGRGLVLVVAGPSAWVSDPLTGTARDEGTSVRGPALRVEVREVTGAAVRLGLQLAPSGLSRLWAARPVPRTSMDAATLLGADVVLAVQEALVQGDDARALATVWAALDRLPRHDSDEADRLCEALRFAESQRGLVRSADLAREAGVSLGELHRWCVHLLGVEPSQWLSAVRFSAFVREAIGPGRLRAEDVLAAVRWYSQAGYNAREVERFTGITPAILRRLIDRLDAFLADRPESLFV